MIDLKRITKLWGLSTRPRLFSDGGSYNGRRGLSTCASSTRSGADILDIGGQSTRPGYEEVSPS